MTPEENRVFLIKYLMSEYPDHHNIKIPRDMDEQKRLLRSLMNIRPPRAIHEEFLKAQDEYLKEVTLSKGITDISELSPIKNDVYLWQGDITTIRCDAIVNAANQNMLGCFCPCHGCIDNAIHTYAGIELRLECAEIMQKQGHAEPVGKAKITKAYNLPCKYVIHTVGPMIIGKVSEDDEKNLSDCYYSCLELAEQKGIKSIAFCCISTGEFHFPNKIAAEIAIKTVFDYKRNTKSNIEVIFNVFKDSDYKICRELLE